MRDFYFYLLKDSVLTAGHPHPDIDGDIRPNQRCFFTLVECWLGEGEMSTGYQVSGFLVLSPLHVEGCWRHYGHEQFRDGPDVIGQASLHR